MSDPLWMQEEWKADSLKWRGEVLMGRFAHWCNEWDGLPVDETTEEFDCCTCAWGDEANAAKAAQDSLREKVRADLAAKEIRCRAGFDCDGCPHCWPMPEVAT